jgi:hypothetical protein
VRGGEKKSAGGSVLRGSGGVGGTGGVAAAWRWSGRERGGPGHDVEQRGGVASALQWPDHGTRGRRVAARQWRTVGSA